MEISFKKSFMTSSPGWRGTRRGWRWRRRRERPEGSSNTWP